ncbi:MAG TPA: SRPBCC family protein [Actinomycetota bacterium]|nr:SRPBCC family protein [Actinomycetota bacterium]
MRVDASVTVPVPPDRLWSVLVRWEVQPRWMRDADRVDVLTSRREGVGVRIAVRTRVLNVPAFAEALEVTAWDPPRRLEIAHRSYLRGTGVWELAPTASGTRFTWSEHVSLPVPLLGELALLAYRPVLRFLMRRGLDDLRRFVIAS